MTFLPIVTRELRVAARRPATYWFRTGAAAMVLVLCLWILGMTRYQTAAQTAETLFAITTGAAALFAGVSGARFTADCISREKRDGTLGLLFLTNLRGYDVVLGKLVAASVDAFYGIMAVVPIMALPLLLGGVSIGEFIRMTLVALNTLFFSLTAGIMVSSFTRSARLGNSLTLLLVIFFAALVPLMGLWIYMEQPNKMPPTYLIPSPGFAYFNAFDSSYARGQNLFWTSLAVVHGLGWVFLGIASLVTPRSWQDRPAQQKSSGSGFSWRTLVFGSPEQAAAFRHRLLNINPYFWLAARAKRQKHMVWGTLLLLAIGWFLGWAKWKREWLDPSTYFITAGVLNLMLRAWFASEGTRQLANDRQTGAIELLLSTPLEPKDIVRGQMLALRRMFLGPLLAILVAEVFLMAATLRETSQGERNQVAVVWLGMMLMLVVDLAALRWVSMWFGLTVRQVNQAAGKSLTWILVFPWLLLCGLMLLGSLNMMRITFEFLLAAWFTLGIGTDIIVSSWAKLKLDTEFREAASRRFTPRKTILERLMRL